MVSGWPRRPLTTSFARRRLVAASGVSRARALSAGRGMARSGVPAVASVFSARDFRLDQLGQLA